MFKYSSGGGSGEKRVRREGDGKKGNNMLYCPTLTLQIHKFTGKFKNVELKGSHGLVFSTMAISSGVSSYNS